jgi:hypothetical protein
VAGSEKFSLLGKLALAQMGKVLYTYKGYFAARRHGPNDHGARHPFAANGKMKVKRKDSAV